MWAIASFGRGVASAPPSGASAKHGRLRRTGFKSRGMMGTRIRHGITRWFSTWSPTPRTLSRESHRARLELQPGLANRHHCSLLAYERGNQETVRPTPASRAPAEGGLVRWCSPRSCGATGRRAERRTSRQEVNESRIVAASVARYRAQDRLGLGRERHLAASWRGTWHRVMEHAFRDCGVYRAESVEVLPDESCAQCCHGKGRWDELGAAAPQRDHLSFRQGRSDIRAPAPNMFEQVLAPLWHRVMSFYFQRAGLEGSPGGGFYSARMSESQPSVPTSDSAIGLGGRGEDAIFRTFRETPRGSCPGLIARAATCNKTLAGRSWFLWLREAENGGAYGRVISSGRTHSSNCSAVSRPSSTPAWRRVVFSACAFFAILAALS